MSDIVGWTPPSGLTIGPGGWSISWDALEEGDIFCFVAADILAIL
jgi:hypothetical protein